MTSGLRRHKTSRSLKTKKKLPEKLRRYKQGNVLKTNKVKETKTIHQPLKIKDNLQRKSAPAVILKNTNKKTVLTRTKFAAFYKIKGHIEIACRKKKGKEEQGHMAEEEFQNATVPAWYDPKILSRNSDCPFP